MSIHLPIRPGGGVIPFPVLRQLKRASVLVVKPPRPSPPPAPQPTRYQREVEPRTRTGKNREMAFENLRYAAERRRLAIANPNLRTGQFREARRALAAARVLGTLAGRLP